MSSDDRRAFEEGVKTITEVGGTLLSLPVAVVGQLVKGVGDVSTGAANANQKPAPPSSPVTSACESESRVGVFAPLIAMIESFIRLTESTGLFLGGRANVPGAKTNPTAAEPESPPRVRLFVAPIATTIYLVGDLAESFKQGLEDVARSSRGSD